MAENENIFLSMNLEWDLRNRNAFSIRHQVPNEHVKYLREQYLNIPLNIDLNDGFDPNSEGPDPELWDGGWRNVLKCLLWMGQQLNNSAKNYSLKNEYKGFTTRIETDTESNESEDENHVKFFCLTNVDCRDEMENFPDIQIQANELFNNNYFKQKAMKWWIQGTVIEMKDVIVGFRNDDGILLRAERVNLEHLREQCEWNGNLCLQAIQLFFTELTNRYDDLVNSEQMLVLERNPNSRDITFSVIPRTEILTNEFRQFFT
uniref:Decapping nuclease n=1 Tax=Panagrolaimus sp. JU765 TaxID=591449 RepID=A0AC34R3D2_9BILA